MNKEEKIWMIPVFWEMSGKIFIKAASAEEIASNFLLMLNVLTEVLVQN